LLASTENSVVVNLQGNTTDVTIAVDYVPQTDQRETVYTVRGTILQANYLPASGYTVEVCDKGIITDTAVAGAPINERGWFETTFSSSVLQKSGKQSPDIFLRIVSDKK